VLRFAIFLGIAATAASFAAPGLAVADTGSIGGLAGLNTLDTTQSLPTAPNAGVAVLNAPSTGGDASNADARGSLANKSPSSALDEQDRLAKGDGAAINASGTDGTLKKIAVDGNSVGPSVSASPQWHAEPAAVAPVEQKLPGTAGIAAASASTSSTPAASRTTSSTPGASMKSTGAHLAGPQHRDR